MLFRSPSLALHNHMITALFYQGKTYFLDGTENYISFNEYAERIQGRPILVEDGDKFISTKVPSTTYLQNLDDERSILTINGNDIDGTVSREWKGEEKESIFTGLNSIEKENSNEAFIKYLSQNNKDYSISNFTSSSLTDYDKPLIVKYQLHQANAVSSFGNDLYVDIDPRKELDQASLDRKSVV